MSSNQPGLFDQENSDKPWYDPNRPNPAFEIELWDLDDAERSGIASSRAAEAFQRTKRGQVGGGESAYDTGQRFRRYYESSNQVVLAMRAEKAPIKRAAIWAWAFGMWNLRASAVHYLLEREGFPREPNLPLVADLDRELYYNPLIELGIKRGG